MGERGGDRTEEKGGRETWGGGGEKNRQRHALLPRNNDEAHVGLRGAIIIKNGSILQCGRPISRPVNTKTEHIFLCGKIYQ